MGVKQRTTFFTISLWQDLRVAKVVQVVIVVVKNKTKKVVAKNEKFYFEAGRRDHHHYSYGYRHNYWNDFLYAWGLLIL